MYKKSTLLVMVIILSMFFLTSCKKENPTETPTSGLIITVGEGLTPKYSWTDANGDSTNAYRLVVYRKDDLGDTIWGIETPEDWFYDGISSPVTHGTVPEGIERYGIADISPLPANITYRVKVQKMNGVQGYKDFSR